MQQVRRGEEGCLCRWTSSRNITHEEDEEREWRSHVRQCNREEIVGLRIKIGRLGLSCQDLKMTDSS